MGPAGPAGALATPGASPFPTMALCEAPGARVAPEGAAAREKKSTKSKRKNTTLGADSGASTHIRFHCPGAEQDGTLKTGPCA